MRRPRVVWRVDLLVIAVALYLVQLRVAWGAEADAKRRGKDIALSVVAAAAPVALFATLLYYREQDRQYAASLREYRRADRPDHARSLRFDALAERRSRNLAMGAVAVAAAGVLVSGVWLFVRGVSPAEVPPSTEDSVAFPAALSVRF